MRRLALLILIALTACAPRMNLDTLAIPASTATTPVPREDAWWRDRFALLEQRVQQGDPQVVFIGDSITQGWEGSGRSVWARHYAPLGAINLGISGDRTQHVLWRIDHGHLDEISPRAVVLMIGTNNSGDDPPKEIADGVMAIVQRLREVWPDTRVLMLGIFPRGAEPGDARRQVCGQATRQFRRVADDRRIFFSDLSAAFLENDGRISKEIMPDYLHLSEEGYERWARAMAEPLEQLLR